jgi:flagellar biosynthesis/type III secretory pathway M-ring protein FliF/YscJ
MGEDGIIYRDNNEIVEVEKIREKKSVHLSAIKQMAKDRPEPTAMLIKTWLTEPTPR